MNIDIGMTRTDLSRRNVFAGLGAAIVALAVPSIRIGKTYTLPRIVLRSKPASWLTMESLYDCIRDLYAQVAELAPRGLNENERVNVAADIDTALDEVRPIGVQILIETSFENMILGEFILRENGYGTVVVS